MQVVNKDEYRWDFRNSGKGKYEDNERKRFIVIRPFWHNTYVCRIPYKNNSTNNIMRNKLLDTFSKINEIVIIIFKFYIHMYIHTYIFFKSNASIANTAVRFCTLSPFFSTFAQPLDVII